MRTSLFILLAISAYYSHVTLNHADVVSAGGYIYVELQVPHATAGLYTSRLELNLPDGTHSAKPEDIHGWNTTIVYRDLPEAEQYMNHGHLVTKAAATLVWQATEAEHLLHNNDVKRFGISMKLGCSYPNKLHATVWNGQHAIWFPTKQYLSEVDSVEIVTGKTLEWTGIVSGAQAWSEGYPKPSPFLLINHWESCNSSASEHRFTFLGKDVKFTGKPKLNAFGSVVQFFEAEIDTVYNILLDRIEHLETKLDQQEVVVEEEKDTLNTSLLYIMTGVCVLLVIALATGYTVLSKKVEKAANPHLEMSS